MQLLGGKHALAIARFEEASAVARRASDAQSLAGAAIGLAQAHLASHRLDLARPATLESVRLAEISGNAGNRIESRLASARLAMEEHRFRDAESELRAAKPMVDQDHDVDLSTRWATLLTESALAQHREPGAAELEQLRHIPAGTPKASLLEAKILLGRATRSPATEALAEARRLGLVLAEANAGAAGAVAVR